MAHILPSILKDKRFLLRRSEEAQNSFHWLQPFSVVLATDLFDLLTPGDLQGHTGGIFEVVLELCYHTTAMVTETDHFCKR